MNDIKKLTAISMVIVLALSSCDKNQDAFEFAKSHVWGDKINGCGYRSIKFFDQFIDYENSPEMVEKVIAIDPEAEVVSKERTRISLVDLGADNFTVEENETKDKMKIYRNGDSLYLYGIYSNGSWKYPERDNSVYPTDYIICET